jgi:hypothetical protein
MKGRRLNPKAYLYELKYGLMRPQCGAFALQCKVEAFEDAAARRYVKGPVKLSTGTDTSALRASSKIESEDTVDILISLIP